MYLEGKMPRISEKKKIESFIKRRRVLELKDLFHVIRTTSRMTVFRRLNDIEYLCSYSHAGRYYTHIDIPQFNADGIWFYDNIVQCA